jgi:hypothetical protein
VSQISVDGSDPNWGGARVADIRAVLHSVAECFAPADLERQIEPILVQPTPATLLHPMCAFTRLPSAQVRVLLSARGRSWAQFAYQFAHEFGHVMANFRPPLQHSSKWIEESLCEAASLFALRRMAERWQHAPPYPNWMSYSASLAKYVDELWAAGSHGLPAGIRFGDWLCGLLPGLRADPLRRADNMIVARELLPVFEADEGAWAVLRYMNMWPVHSECSTTEFFALWANATPPSLRGRLARLENQLTGRCRVP